MRKILPLLFFLLGLINAVGQTVFNYGFHNRYEIPFKFLVNTSGSYYFISANYGSAIFNNTLYRIDKFGKVRLQKTYKYSEVNEVRSFFKTLDNKLFEIGKITPCDYFPPHLIWSYLQKTDTNGNVIFYTKVNTVGNLGLTSWYFDPLKTGVQNLDSTYSCFSDSTLYLISKNGVQISRVSLKPQNISSITSCIALPNQNCLVSAKVQGQNVLIELNQSGQIVNQKNVPVLFTKIQRYNSQNFIGLSGNLYKLSPSRDLIGVSVFNSGSAVLDFHVAGDSIYSITSNTTTSKYYITDTAFNVLHERNITKDLTTYAAILSDNDGVAILSDARSSGGENNYSILNRIPKDSTLVYTHDAAVCRLQIDSTYSESKYSFGAVTYSTYFRGNIWVKNHGVTPINKFKVNLFYGNNSVCGKSFYQSEHEKLVLNPGDSLKLLTGWVRRFNGLIGPPPVTITENYCFYTTLPNGEADANVMNDGVCLSTSFLITGVKEIDQVITQEISVSPNPFTTSIKVSCPVEIKNLEILDVSGRQLYSKEAGKREEEVVVDGLPPGVYFIKLNTEKGPFYKKLIKSGE